MARTIEFSFMQGGGATFTNGRVTISPTSVRTEGIWTVLPSETDPIYLVDGVGSIPDIDPTPTDPDGWRYQIRVEATDRRVHEFLVEVPDGTTPINFNLLPQISAMTLPIDATGVQLKQWIESVRSHANAANENALEALAQIASYHGGSANPTKFDTVDSWEEKKIVTYADGSVKAIPYTDMPPDQPGAPSAVPGSTMITITWTLAAPAVRVQLLRNGTVIYDGNESRWVDRNVSDGVTYTYTLIAYDQWNQRSILSGTATAAADTDLNLTPDCTVTCWPNPLPINGTGIIRVCGADGEAQQLALSLTVTSGTITPTSDPSKWIFTA